jgi:hypothetical protein
MANEENNAKSWKERRENFMETYNHDPILSKKLPEVAAGLMKAEFGVNILDHSHIPIVFTVGWTEILKKLGSEQTEECKVNICGAQLEYITEKSESDKSTNIVPQMYHVKTPLFQQREQAPTIGASYTDTLMANYNAWRSVYALEAITGIENKVFEAILNDFGINLMVPAAIYPIIGATYAAGIQIARETKQTVNMYNIFEIDVVEDDKVILTPLAYIKQWLKDDSKKL